LRGVFAIWGFLKTRHGRRIAFASAFVLACALGILQALGLRVPLYDVGLFHQIFWGLTHGQGFVSTISGAGDFMLDHLSPALALIAPVFYLVPRDWQPLTLMIVHPLLIFTGIAAWIWLAERLAPAPEPGTGRESSLAAGATLFALSFDSLWGNLRWGFHENAIAFATLSWAYALIFSRRTERSWLSQLGVLILFLLAAASKEIILLDVSLALCVWAALQWSRQRVFAIKLLVLALALIVSFVWFEKLPHPADKNYFDRYYSYLGHNLRDFSATLLLAPWVVVRQVGAMSLSRYFLTVFLPWLFLPLYLLFRDRRQGVWLLALTPSLASAALATYGPLRGSGFHYVLELWPVLAVLTIWGLAQLRSPRWAIAWALLALLAWDHDPWGEWREYWDATRAESQARVALSSLPAEASVSADELAGPWVAGRARVTRWPALAILGGHCPEWVAVRGDEQMAQVDQLCQGKLQLRESVAEWRIYSKLPPLPVGKE
jgi:uncharacterized membrane protein